MRRELMWEDGTIAGAIGWVICLLDLSSPLIYAFLICVTLLSVVSPFLRDLSAHGKTRRFVVQRRSSRFVALVHHFAQEWEVEKSFFIHFYIIGLASLALCWTLSSNQTWKLPLLLLATHLMRRFYECVFVHKWRPSSKMHIMGYLAGMAHYLWLPFVFLQLPCADRVCPYYLEYSHFLSLWSGCSQDARTNQVLAPSWCCLSVFLIGLWAQYQQHRHHVLLANLRTSDIKEDRKSKYGIPTGGWFQLVSCPHYLAEIILYCCFAILIYLESPDNLCRSLLVLVFVVSNLAVTAKRTHRWYLENSPGYAKLRQYALIPFLY